MRALVIACIYSEEKCVGYRLLSIPDNDNFTSNDKFTTYDATIPQIISVVKSRKLDILNIYIQNNKIHGFGGSLDRYAKIDTTGVKISKNSPLVLISKIIDNKDTAEFIVSDFRGKVVTASERDVITYSKNLGISNGKVVTLENGTEYIAQVKDTIIKQSKLKGLNSRQNKMEENKSNGCVDLCPKHNWSVAELREYLDSIGIDYSIENSTLLYIDAKIKSFKVPYDLGGISSISKDGLDSILEHIEIQDTHIDCKLLSHHSSLKTIRFYGKAVNIESTNFTNEVEIHIPIGLNIILEDTITEIHGLFNNWRFVDALGKIVEDNTSEQYIAKVLQHMLRLPELTHIERCFNNVHLGDTPVVLSSSLKFIETSFRNTELMSLDMSKIQSMLSISLSFVNNNLKVKQLRLMKSKERLYLSDSFLEGSRLKTLELSDSNIDFSGIDNILDDQCEITVNMVDGDRSIRKSSVFRYRRLSDSTTVKFKNRKFLGWEELLGLRCKEVELNEGMECLGERSLMAAKFKLKIPSTLRLIKAEAFSNFYDTDKIDLSNCKELHTIEDSAFKFCDIECIILPDSLKIIGDNCFKDAKRLRYLYIPKDIQSIGRSAIQNSGSEISTGLTILTYKGSKGDKYAKANRVNIIYVESIQEAIEKIESDKPKISEKQKDKLRLLLSADELGDVLLSDKYIDRASELIKIVEALSNTDININALDRRKLIDVDIDKAYGISPDDPDETDATVKLRTKNYTDNTILPVINVITTYTTDFNSLAENRQIREILNSSFNANKKSKRPYLWVKSENYVIYSNSFTANNTKLAVISIAYKNRVIYTTIINVGNEIIEFVDLNESCISNIAPLQKTLGKGIIYPFGRNSLDFGMPTKIKSSLGAELREQLLLIGAERISASNKKSWIKVVMLSTSNGDILDCEVNLVKSIQAYKNRQGERTIDPNIITSIRIKNIYKIGETPEYINEMIKDTMLNQKHADQIVNNILNIQDDKSIETQEIEISPCLEWEMSKLLQDYNIEDVSSLNAKALSLIINLDILLPAKHGEFDYEPVEVIISSDGEAVIKSYALDKRTVQSTRVFFRRYSNYYIEFTGRINNKYVRKVFLAYKKFTGIVKDIKSIRDESKKPEYIVDNHPVNMDNFYIIRGGGTFTGYSIRAQLIDAVNRANGTVFTLLNLTSISDSGDVISQRAYKILRFDSIKDAMLADTVIEQKTNGKVSSDYRNYSINEMYSSYEETLKEILKANKPKSNVMIARDAIMRGYKDGYNIGGKAQEIFDLAAKQNKI